MILVNGEQLDSVSALDRGVQYGDGLFETIAVYQQTPLAFDLHLQRLKKGCERLGISYPDESLLYDECVLLAKAQHKAVIKLIVSRGEGGRGYMPPPAAEPTRITQLFPWPEQPSNYSQDGVITGICEGRLSRNPMLAGIKHLNRLEQVMLKKEVSQRYPEALVMDTSDKVIEGIMSNIFIVHGNKLITPSLEQAGVDGVIRSAILMHSKSMDLMTEVSELVVEDVLSADEFFFCNSLIGIWPVKELKDRQFERFDTAQQISHFLKDHSLIAP